jgi:hypothetical protein
MYCGMAFTGDEAGNSERVPIAGNNNCHGSSLPGLGDGSLGVEVGIVGCHAAEDFLNATVK